ncbi:hypothetical protein CMI38_06930 [Candidatus Pacearchaeota archaeon]|jgi:hypothetical protein|nr:hypothetical protein [Candidatus Pacearchaeota archaeon]|tara:strand:- start:8066 stop:8467 length:402 start_codon:yes stop_codon:yes gene_type:complete
MSYEGIIIEESLENRDVLDRVEIVSTRVEEVTDKHKTPWIDKWTLHSVEVSEDIVERVAEKLSESIDREHGDSWYIDFKNDMFHYIIFLNKFFKVDRLKPEQYGEVVQYGVGLGIPDYQLSFDPNWEKNPDRL